MVVNGTGTSSAWMSVGSLDVTCDSGRRHLEVFGTAPAWIIIR
jgi:hypothetical protein